MRSTPIVDIIRKYGLSSRRLSPKAHIRYEEAIKKITAYESTSLKIADVIDNGLFPSKSVSCHCQMPGCNHRIRYEYILENKESGEKVVAGSTCVWPALGFSELQVKEFKGLEAVLKEHHALVEWRNANPDVITILSRLRDEEFNSFRPFWQEIEYARLTDKDTEYIRSINVDEMIQKREETRAQRMYQDADYKKVLEGLENLVKAYPDNAFYANLYEQSKQRRLSRYQVKYVKIGCNKLWYQQKIRGTKNDIMDQADGIILPLLEKHNISMGKPSNNQFIQTVNQLVASMDARTKLAWNLFKVSHELVIYQEMASLIGRR